MGLIVNTNIASQNAQRNLSMSNSGLSKSLERLSSGLRINRAADDAAGLAIATKLSAQVRGLNQAARNANNAISLVQTAEGAINTITNILQRLRELAVQSASDDNTSADRGNLDSESDNLLAELSRVANTSEFNTLPLLDGSYTGKYFQVGANYQQTISFSIGDIRGKSLGTRATISGTLTDNGAFGGINAHISSGEVTINSQNILTTTGDDTVSVLEMRSGLISSTGSAGAGAGNALASLVISNGASTGSVAINAVDATGAASVASYVNAFVAAINNAGVSGVSARAYTTSASGSNYWVLQATGGKDVTLYGTGEVAGNGMASLIGSSLGTTAAASSFIGSSAAAAITTRNGQSSAIAKAAAVNSVKGNTSVSGTAESNTYTAGALTAGTITSGDLYINGVNIGAVTVLSGDGDGALVTAINSHTSATGVSASINSSSQLVLTATDGRNITLHVGDSADAVLTASGGTGNTNNVQRGTVTLNSKSAITIGGTNYTEIGSNVTAQTYQADLTNKVSLVDISTQSGAQSAILTLDAALDQLNTRRAEIGAIQNRMEHTIANLQIAAENMSASESRIKDADFAFETALFTRNQVMVQAGTAIVAQANTTTQIALQLLK